MTRFCYLETEDKALANDLSVRLGTYVYIKWSLC